MFDSSGGIWLSRNGDAMWMDRKGNVYMSCVLAPDEPPAMVGEVIYLTDPKTGAFPGYARVYVKPTEAAPRPSWPRRLLARLKGWRRA